MLNKGYIQSYYGSGKGKTTAAIGLAIRAIGAGLKVSIVQFMKTEETSEFVFLKNLNENLSINAYGNGEFFFQHKSNIIEHRAYIQKALEQSKTDLKNKNYDVIILDEILNALDCGLITYEEILNLLKIKFSNTELVLTGRKIPSDLLEYCDLATEMKEIKHYYKSGVKSRDGIEK